MFGRLTGTDDEIALRGMFDENLGIETSGIAHDRKDLAEKGLVAGEEVMLPEMAAEPGGTHWPQPRRCAVYGSGDAPLVGVVMEHPAVGTVHLAGSLTTRLGHLADEFEQGAVHLREVTDLRRPVVHLEVDVRGVFRVPRREHFFIP